MSVPLRQRVTSAVPCAERSGRTSEAGLCAWVITDSIVVTLPSGAGTLQTLCPKANHLLQLLRGLKACNSSASCYVFANTCAPMRSVAPWARRLPLVRGTIVNAPMSKASRSIRY
jgi:hypothetical protein